MCFDADSSPPIPVISGAAVSHDDLVLEAADGNRFAAFRATPDDQSDTGIVILPDVRGLFYSVGLELTGRIGLHLTPIQLTQNPMPTDGLIVDQRPRSPTKVRRDSELEVEVWHPPACPAK